MKRPVELLELYCDSLKRNLNTIVNHRDDVENTPQTIQRYKCHIKEYENAIRILKPQTNVKD